nr:hypothetical protein [Deltaproteobacteria bacterium]
LRNEVPSFVGRTVLDEVAQRMLVERHPERSGRADTRTLWDAELTRWKDTGVYLNTLDVLRQADLVPEKLHGNSAVEGLAAWRALLDDRGCLDFTAIMEHAVRCCATTPTSARASLGASATSSSTSTRT